MKYVLIIVSFVILVSIMFQCSKRKKASTFKEVLSGKIELDLNEQKAIANLLDAYKIPAEKFTIDTIDDFKLNALVKDKHLIELSLNKIPVSDMKFISNFKHLKSLEISNAKIKRIEAIEQLEQLQHLNLNYNKISELIVVQENNVLHTLFLIGNDISKLKGIKKLKKLDLLDLSNNNLHQTIEIDSLKELRILGLNENQIRKLFIKDTPKLSILSCNKNLLEHFEVRGVKKLDVAEIENNQLRSFKFINSYIQTLDIRNNPIKELPEELPVEFAFNSTIAQVKIKNEPKDKEMTIEDIQQLIAESEEKKGVKHTNSFLKRNGTATMSSQKTNTRKGTEFTIKKLKGFYSVEFESTVGSGIAITATVASGTVRVYLNSDREDYKYKYLVINAGETKKIVGNAPGSGEMYLYTLHVESVTEEASGIEISIEYI